jgi:threonine dehydratase
MMPNRLVSLDDVVRAAERIKGLARTTPLLEVDLLDGDAASSGPLWLKCENLQLSGAFKIRGAANVMRQLPAADLERGVITFSSGNHGLALALAARRMGVPAVIVMPVGAPRVKVEGARRLGAEIVFEGTTTIERKARAEAIAAARGLTVVPPFDHEWIIAGQGTVGLEIVEQCRDVGTVYVPASGGGLLAGVAVAVKGLKPGVRVIGVEPAGAPKMTRSRSAGAPVTLGSSASIADGLLAVRPGDITFRHVQALVDDIVTVEEAAIASAVGWLFQRARIVAEPSGAVTLAAALSDAHAGGAPRVAVVSGGNVEASAFASYIAGS